MSLPAMSAEVSLGRSETFYATQGGGAAAPSGTVVPQLSACTPCVQLGGGRRCVRLLGRRICVNIPSFGRWHICCRTRWGWPPISCSVSRC